ncbi:MAG: hypothetical protein HRT66_01350 [Flavobacteriaceae bacterium]|nr:hypothetical protein [Flavobacteriaceae bacterium]
MKGIIIAVPKKYEEICLHNIIGIRKYNSEIPIEIWEIGNEISPKIKHKFSNIKHVYFKNINDYSDDSNNWKGFQIKAFILLHTSFSQVLLCDADVIIHQNIDTIFEDDNYIKTGTYFFKDLDKWTFHKLNNKWIQIFQLINYNKFTNLKFFNRRKKWLLELLPHKKDYFPIEWNYIYEDETPNKPVKEALQESGVVFINREKHAKSIKHIYELNNSHKETYKYIWGDKETFWIGCLLSNSPFYFNPTPGYISNKTGLLTHKYKGVIFFSQKG